VRSDSEPTIAAELFIYTKEGGVSCLALSATESGISHALLKVKESDDAPFSYELLIIDNINREVTLRPVQAQYMPTTILAARFIGQT